MKIAVVDDEHQARSELVYLLRQVDEKLEILEAESAERLQAILNETGLDACFLDINLSGMNGTTLASLVRSRQPGIHIVFATAYQEYAVKAFDLGAVDYLLKPYDFERVKKTVERLKTLEKESAPEEGLGRIMVQGNGRLQILDISAIVYIETANRTCRIYTARDCFVQNESLNYYEKRLRNQNFFRIHKSFLVNLAYVNELIPFYNNGHAVVMKYYEKTPLPVGRQQIRELRRIFE